MKREDIQFTLMRFYKILSGYNESFFIDTVAMYDIYLHISRLVVFQFYLAFTDTVMLC